MRNEISFQELAEWLKKEDIYYIADGGNAGDALLAYATYSFFADYEIKLLDKPHKNSLIVFGGGGNLIEGLYVSMAKMIKEYCKAGYKVLVLSHTVKGYTSLWKRYEKQIRIICREKVSYDGLIEQGISEDCLMLCDDMALYLEEKNLEAIYRDYQSNKNLTLCNLRKDKEGAYKDLDIKNNIDLSLILISNWAYPEEAEAVTKYFLLFIALHKIIITDRLHIGIACGLMNRDCYLVSNNYYKIKAIYDYSLAKRFPNLHYVEKFEDIPQDICAQIGNLGNSTEVLSALHMIKEKNLAYRLGRKFIKYATSFIPSKKWRYSKIRKC